MEKAKTISIIVLLVVVAGLILYVVKLRKDIEGKATENIELIEENKQKQIELMNMVLQMDSLKTDYSLKQDSLKQAYQNEKEELEYKLDSAINRLNYLTDDEHIQLLTDHLSKKGSN